MKVLWHNKYALLDLDIYNVYISNYDLIYFLIIINRYK